MNSSANVGKESNATNAELGGSAGPVPTVTSQRNLSLDVYRGLIMISLVFNGFGLVGTASRHLRSLESEQAAARSQEPSVTTSAAVSFWEGVRYQFSHCEWVGCTYWDLVQPSFVFMVGAAMPYSYSKRRKLGASGRSLLGHAVTRSLVLVLMGIFLSSNWSRATNWTFVNVLAQIGLGYTFLFLLWQRTLRVQVLAAMAILVVTWILYLSYPNAGVDLTTGAPEVGVTKAWGEELLAGVGEAWHKNANVGHAIDVWFLNLFPRAKPYEYNSGGYQTLNFLPSICWMIFGLMAGNLMKSGRSAKEKITILLGAGIAGILLGLLMDGAHVCPLVKRICTPSFILLSSGWCSITLGTLYGIVDMLGVRFWIFPFVVVGMNSIAAYWMHMLLGPWISKALQTHLGESVYQLQFTFGKHTFRPFGESAEEVIALVDPFIEATMIGMVMWLICWWMYRQKLFVRI